MSKEKTPTPPNSGNGGIPAANVTEPCPLRGNASNAQRGKRYYHVGLRMQFSQYAVRGREMSLALPMHPHFVPKETTSEDFHKLSNQTFEPANSCDLVRDTLKVYPLDKCHFEADLACATQLIAEDGQLGYAKGPQQTNLNDFLGKAVALHLSRDKTFQVTSTGDFEAKNMQRFDPLAKTEMLCMELHVYMMAKIDGAADKIYQIIDGAIAGEITQTDYDKRKYMEEPLHKDKEGGLMPYIPGVYQVHTLIAATQEGDFKLQEVHCDGDCIFP